MVLQKRGTCSEQARACKANEACAKERTQHIADASSKYDEWGGEVIPFYDYHDDFKKMSTQFLAYARCGTQVVARVHYNHKVREIWERERQCQKNWEQCERNSECKRELNTFFIDIHSNATATPDKIFATLDGKPDEYAALGQCVHSSPSGSAQGRTARDLETWRAELPYRSKTMRATTCC